MTQYKNILVLQRKNCDSTRALVIASRLAKQAAASRIHVIDAQPTLTSFWDDLVDTDFHNQQKEIRAQQLREMVEPFENECSITYSVLTGRLVVELVSYIQENDIDLVVKVGGGTAGHSILSSLDQRMVRQCPADLAVVSATESFSSLSEPAETRLPNVIVAIHPADDEAENKMNVRLLQKGALLAETFDLQLNVVSAVPPPGIQMAHNEEAIEACSLFEKKAMKRGREYLRRTLGATSITVEVSKTIFEFAEPESLILKQVNELQPDFLVMGSVVRGWVSGLLIGSVTDRVSDELTCSLFALRPDEAISTVASRIDV